ncbi:hypothetical protein GMDG_06626 [Pseudogymnoascus destructans 20631-21]|uniref:Alpha-1,2-mannosyltransferase (Kre5) n=1 Tax=Pseudogymnoascus destructans (strain ATCC MYA-4855 / 20631-21) TaxID=658429 RepID=L8FWX5_PSED2|nr:hypothetical protein GMDG_06626 [Pseudogymnoascus destructans 20631-21]
MVVICILVLFVQHPSSPGRGLLMPAGGPPTIRKISEKYDKVFELEGVIQSLKSIERHFNRWYHYLYVFLNDGDFNSTFKETVQNHTSSSVEFGKIDSSMWGFPDWIDPRVAKEGIAKQGDAAIMYGGMESYHSMCRYYSGFFYKHELLQNYEWYWRLELEIKYFCDITYDPFQKMIENNKTYGFTIAVKELKETVPNIFRYASAYMRTNNIKSKRLWEMFVEPDLEGPKKKRPEDTLGYKPPIPEPILRKGSSLPDVDPEAMEGEKYNMCHFWSNFEIASLSWFRSEEYEDFFQMMDRSGGFWMERWGDAPIHSLAAGALLSPSQQDEYWDSWDDPKENGVGCRCRCDTAIVDVEGKEESCMAEWVDVAGGWASP